MKIHSSSLTLTHASLNRHQAGKQSSARNKDESKELLSIRNSQDNNNSLFPSYPSEEIRPVLDISGLNNAFPDKENSVSPRNARVLRALTAYSQELNQLLADQSNHLAQSIDTFA